VDGVWRVCDRCERATSDGPAGDDGEEAFDGVDSAGQCSREQTNPARVIYLALHDVGVSMGGGVVDGMDALTPGTNPSTALKKI
jgi:hypothetical protein